MTEAVAEALAAGEHLLVQAGTGTGKSLGYLVPAVAHAMATGRPVVVSTATLALQAQVVDRDLPLLADALAARPRPPPHLAAGQGPAQLPVPEQAAPVDTPPTTTLSSSCRTPPVRPPRRRGWAARWCGCAPGRSGPGPATVTSWFPGSASGPGGRSRSARTSVWARSAARWPPSVTASWPASARTRVDVVVSNHAFVAIDAFEGRQMLPDHQVLVVDEAHELADRVTSVISDELTAPLLEAAARRAARAGLEGADALQVAAATLAAALATRRRDGSTGSLPEAVRLAVASAPRRRPRPARQARPGPLESGR